MSKTHPCANCHHTEDHSELVGCLADYCECQSYVSPQVGRTIPSRRSDPGTSHNAATAIKVKAGTQRAKLLLAFRDAPTTRLQGDLTDEEAMEDAEGVSPVSEYAKRCSELRDAGLIEPTGETRKGASGVDRIVSVITDAGRTAAQAL